MWENTSLFYEEPSKLQGLFSTKGNLSYESNFDRSFLLYTSEEGQSSFRGQPAQLRLNAEQTALP